MATDLEKSHSKASNAKLTMICLIQAIAFALAFAGCAILAGYNRTLGLTIAIVGIVGLILTTTLVNAFTRG